MFLHQKLFGLLDVLTGKTRGERLGKLVGLLTVSDGEGVEVLGAANLKLGLLSLLVDLDELGVGSAGLLEEVANVGDGLRHFYLLFIGETEGQKCERGGWGKGGLDWRAGKRCRKTGSGKG